MVPLRRAYALGLLLLALTFTGVWLAGIRAIEPLAIGVVAVVIVYGAFHAGVRYGRRQRGRPAGGVTRGRRGLPTARVDGLGQSIP